MAGHDSGKIDIFPGRAVSWQRFKNFFCLAWTELHHVADWLPASVATVFRFWTNLAGLKLAEGPFMNYRSGLIVPDYQ